MAIGNAIPHPAAGLDVVSSNKGILLPRIELLATTDPNAVPDAAEGVLIYNTRLNTINGQSVGFYYNTSPASLKVWVRWATGAPLSAIWNRDGNSLVNGTTDFLGTTDDKPLHFRVNNLHTGSLMHSSANYFFAGTNKSSILGTQNIGLGQQALNAVTTGNQNTALGAEALFGNSSGSANVAVGHLAYYFGSLSSQVTAIGYGALQNAFAAFNTAMGAEALMESNRTQNLAFGFRALKVAKFQDSHPSLTTQNTVAVGHEAMLNVVNCLNTTALGSGAIGVAETSKDNLAVGRDALKNATQVGERNIAIGMQALQANVSGAYNIGVGTSALKSLNSATSNYNVAIGFEALGNLQVSANNTAVGVSAAGSINTSSNGGLAGNTAVGMVAMAQLTTSVFSTAIGFGAFILGNYSNSTAIGANCLISEASNIRFGNSGVSSIGGQVAWTSLSDGRAKTQIQALPPSVSFIKTLRPVSYTFDVAGIRALENSQDIQVPLHPVNELDDKTIHTGFVAQQVRSVVQDYPIYKNIVDEGPVLGLRYELMVVPLVKTIQEQQATIRDVQKLIADLEAQLQTLQNLQK
jgi:hypothetical protein